MTVYVKYLAITYVFNCFHRFHFDICSLICFVCPIYQIIKAKANLENVRYWNFVFFVSFPPSFRRKYSSTYNTINLHIKSPVIEIFFGMIYLYAMLFLYLRMTERTMWLLWYLFYFCSYIVAILLFNSCLDFIYT